ncbi:CHAP domain-containing protein [Cellulomonas sp. NPDC089187]|uniref:CHAP domain-containing protein n=1 Tax=Cellulomonas sp. NPDC089187 TaxID=3154970 RepID=UPI00342209FC
MSTAARVLEIARSQLGTVGGARYQSAHGVRSGAWCAYFATWVLREAGLSEYPWTGWTPALVTWARARGRWKTTDPRPGDLVLYMWPGVSPSGRGSPPVCHTGIVEARSGGGLYAIEGNTSAGTAGSQYNGNRVARRLRSSAIVGYVDLQNLYGATSAAGSAVIAEDGVRGPATITRWQQVLGTPADGVISRPVSSLIQADQRYLNATVPTAHIRDLTGAAALVVDGIEGPATIRVRQFWLFNTQGQSPTVADFDGIAGPATTRLHQRALNRASIGSGRY